MRVSTQSETVVLSTYPDDFKLNVDDVLWPLSQPRRFRIDLLDVEEDVGDGPRKIHCTSLLCKVLEPCVSAKEPDNHLHEQTTQSPDIVGPRDCATLDIAFGRSVAWGRRDGPVGNVGSAALAVE